VLLVNIIIGSVCLSSASASNLSASIVEGTAHVSILATLSQNLTMIERREQTLTGEELTGAQQVLLEAIRERSPNASLHDLHVRFSGNVSHLNVTLDFRIGDIAYRRGSTLVVDCVWKAFVLRKDIVTGNFSLNSVGRTLLRPIMEKFSNITSARFFLNKTVSVSPEVAFPRVGNATLLNFVGLSAPLERWSKSYNVTEHRTTWKFEAVPTLDFAMSTKEGNTTLNFYAIIDPVAEISISTYARAEGNEILVGERTGFEELGMAAVIVILFVVGVTAANHERRLLRPKR